MDESTELAIVAGALSAGALLALQALHRALVVDVAQAAHVAQVAQQQLDGPAADSNCRRTAHSPPARSAAVVAVLAVLLVIRQR